MQGPVRTLLSRLCRRLSSSPRPGAGLGTTSDSLQLLKLALHVIWHWLKLLIARQDLPLESVCNLANVARVKRERPDLSDACGEAQPIISVVNSVPRMGPERGVRESRDGMLQCEPGITSLHDRLVSVDV